MPFTSEKKWKADKKFGDVIEDEIVKILSKKFPNVEKTTSKGKFSGYDIIARNTENDDQLTVEVKGDYESNNTNNIIIEVEMNDQPSALSVTKADFWVIVDGYVMIWIEPIDIYRFIEMYNTQRVMTVGNGDNKPKIAHFLKKNQFLKFVKTREKSAINSIKESSPIYFDNIMSKFNRI